MTNPEQNKEEEITPEDFYCGGCGECEACLLYKKQHTQPIPSTPQLVRLIASK